MAALEASLAAVRSGSEDEPAPKKPRRRAPAKSADGDGAARAGRVAGDRRAPDGVGWRTASAKVQAVGRGRRPLFTRR